MTHDARGERHASGSMLNADGLSRRDFLALAGMTTASFALKNNAEARETQAQAGRQSGDLHFDAAQLANTHDLVWLPAWGPYSKKLFGISHIPEVTRGLSFDVSLFPMLTQGPAKLPNVTGHAGVHPWEAAPDLDFYSFRMELLRKDQLYCELAFCRLTGHSRLARMEIVNETDAPQEIVVNCLAQLCFPPLRELTAEPIRLCGVELPPGAVWVHALDYADLTFAKARPTDNLVPDGKLRGEARLQDCVGGSVVAQGFGRDAGDTLQYRLDLDHAFAQAVLVWRFQPDRGQRVGFRMSGAAQGEIVFEGSGEFATVAVPLGPLSAGTHDLRFVSEGGAAIVLNGFVLAETEQAGSIRFPPKPWSPAPKIERVGSVGILLQYRDVANSYGLALEAGWPLQRELKWRDLDDAFHTHSSEETRERIFGNGHGNRGDPDSLFVHAASKPLIIPPRSRRVLYGMVCAGPPADVRQALQGFEEHSSSNERAFRTAQGKGFQFTCSPSGEPFRFSQQLMAAVTLTNLVYPLYTQRSYIRHNSPGKIWDCLYTWDSGFIGLGLLEFDPRRALDDLNAYTTPEGAQSAFIHHGTPLPTQIYLYLELWNRTQSKEMLAYFYPRLRQYHRFLAGRLGSSTTRRHKDHLIVTWDYFYNSGGWDDYPPQKFVHAQNLTSVATPVVNSAHTIRCAKLLRHVAQVLGHTDDCAEYESDIATLSSSLQRYSWDEESGYFGYVMHDASGTPTGILRTRDGVNFNLGLGGVSPLIAGICTLAQTRRLLDHLFSEKGLWTGIGITTVDQSAPYYNPDGYWNGSVWLAHQWFLWKTMLDLGRGDLAVRIAKAALGVWKQATDTSYDCMEHFVPHPPFGEGWIQFSSLSSPALSWFAALYTPGRFTCGFDTWIETCAFGNDRRRLDAKLESAGAGVNRERSVLACMSPDRQYRVLWNGAAAESIRVHDGLLRIQLPSGAGELSVVSD